MEQNNKEGELNLLRQMIMELKVQVNMQTKKIETYEKINLELSIKCKISEMDLACAKNEFSKLKSEHIKALKEIEIFNEYDKDSVDGFLKLTNENRNLKKQLDRFKEKEMQTREYVEEKLEEITDFFEDMRK